MSERIKRRGRRYSDERNRVEKNESGVMNPRAHSVPYVGCAGEDSDKL